jgi:uncharacterized protein (DUF433 family)
MSRDATALFDDALRLPANERMELASRLLAQESSVISAQLSVMSGAPVFKGTRVLVQTLIEYLEAGDSIDDFVEGFPSVSREQVIAFLEETKARVIPTPNEQPKNICVNLRHLRITFLSADERRCTQIRDTAKPAATRSTAAHRSAW